MQITAANAARSFGQMVDYVLSGEVVTVTRYGRPVLEMRRPEPTVEDEAFAQGAEALDRIAKGGAMQPPRVILGSTEPNAEADQDGHGRMNVSGWEAAREAAASPEAEPSDD